MALEPTTLSLQWAGFAMRAGVGNTDEYARELTRNAYVAGVLATLAVVLRWQNVHGDQVAVLFDEIERLFPDVLPPKAPKQ